jgi:hypothetical protein
MNNQTWRHL